MFFHSFTFNLHVSLGLKWISFRQYIDGCCCCFIHSDTLCVLSGTFNLFIFKVIIDSYVFIVILLLVLLFLEISMFLSCVYPYLSLLSTQSVHFNISCSVILVVMDIFIFCLSGKLFTTLYILNDNLDRQSILGWRLFPFSTLNI